MYGYKETFEWISAWCDYAPQNDLPRVLLVGDSICMGYQQRVRELLKGVCYVDYFSNTYAVDKPLYRKMLKDFYADSEYALVHFNHGLHGGHMGVRTYKSQIAKLLAGFDTKITVATSTVVYEEGNKKLSKVWKKLVNSRNSALLAIAEESGYGVDDLYEISVAIPKEHRNADGIHYLAEGYELLARQVAKSVKESLGGINFGKESVYSGGSGV